MDDNRLPKKMLSYKPEDKKNIGRLLMRWKDDFQEEETGQGALYFMMKLLFSISF